MRTEPLDIHRTRFPNRLRLLIWENQQLPLVTVLGVVRAGADCNPSDRAGLAAITARLLEDGTVRFPAETLLHMIENVGSHLSTFSQRELSGVILTSSPEQLRQGLELVGEMLQSPVFPPDRFLLGRERSLNDVQSLADEPHQVTSDLLDSLVYEATPLALPLMGTEQSLGNTRREDLVAYHERNFGPQNTILVVVGACRPQEVEEQVAKLFANWDNPHFLPPPTLHVTRQTRRRSRSLRLAKEQIHICMGHLAITRMNPDFHALQILDVILGSGPGFTSRIPRKLRDELGLAYTAYSDMTSSSGVYPGRFIAYIGTAPEKRIQALDGLLREIEDIRERGVTSEELETARNFLTGSFVFDFQSNADVARFLVITELFNLSEDYPQRHLDEIRAIDQEEVARVARLYLDTLNYSVVCVGPVDEESQLESSFPADQ